MFRLALLSMLALIPFAVAQDPCTEAAPCPLPVDIDTDTLDFGGEPTYTVTAGDWFYFDAFNLDDFDHEIIVAELDIAFVATGGVESSEHGPYLFDIPGTFMVQDVYNGATATLIVTESDVTEAAAEEAPEQGAPGFGIMAGLLALAFVAIRRS